MFPFNQTLTSWHWSKLYGLIVYKFNPLEDKKSLKIPKGNQNPWIEEEQTKQWTKEKVQKDKQRSTKHTHKTKDLVTRAPLRRGGELRCSGRVSSTCSTSGIRRVNLVTNPVISHEWGKDREFFNLWYWHLCYIITIWSRFHVKIVFHNWQNLTILLFIR